jgi:hypothetical protein
MRKVEAGFAKLGGKAGVSGKEGSRRIYQINRNIIVEQNVIESF